MLQDLKTNLSSMPALVAPKPQESLLLYLAATNQVVSAALVALQEVDEGATVTTIHRERKVNLSQQDQVQIKTKRSGATGTIPRSW